MSNDQTLIKKYFVVLFKKSLEGVEMDIVGTHDNKHSAQADARKAARRSHYALVVPGYEARYEAPKRSEMDEDDDTPRAKVVKKKAKKKKAKKKKDCNCGRVIGRHTKGEPGCCWEGHPSTLPKPKKKKAKPNG